MQNKFGGWDTERKKERKRGKERIFLTNEIHDNDDEADLRKFGTKHSKKILAAY
jgi:hypothetical protein